MHNCKYLDGDLQKGKGINYRKWEDLLFDKGKIKGWKIRIVVIYFCKTNAVKYNKINQEIERLM